MVYTHDSFTMDVFWYKPIFYRDLVYVLGSVAGSQVTQFKTKAPSVQQNIVRPIKNPWQ